MLGRPGIRRCNQKLLQLASVAHVFHEIPCTRMDEKLFVVPQAMEEIQNREVPRLVNIERGRKNDAVGNRAVQDFAWNRVALDAASRE